MGLVLLQSTELIDYWISLLLFWLRLFLKLYNVYKLSSFYSLVDSLKPLADNSVLMFVKPDIIALVSPAGIVVRQHRVKCFVRHRQLQQRTVASEIAYNRSEVRDDHDAQLQVVGRSAQ